MRELLWRNLDSIYISEDKCFLVFINMDWRGKKPDCWVYEAIGPCSGHYEAWFESLNGMENIINSKILSIDINIEKTIKKLDDSLSDYDTIIIYGYTIKTAKGACDIEVRNENNGYYGSEECECHSHALLTVNNLNGDYNTLHDDIMNKNPIRLFIPGRELICLKPVKG